MNESRMKSMGESLESNSSTQNLIDGFNVGRISSLSILNEAVGVGEPTVSWHAYDPSLDSSGDWSPLGGSGGITFADIAGKENQTGNKTIVINSALAEDLQVPIITAMQLNRTGERGRANSVVDDASAIS